MSRGILIILRLARFAALLAWAGLDYFLRVFLPGRSRSVGHRARWLQRASRRILGGLNVEVATTGKPCPGGLLVSNHVGYLDVLVLAREQPAVFVSKREVRSWPVIGWLTRCGGTLFLDRGRRQAVGGVAAGMAGVIHGGTTVALFPEGTSSDGLQVLPFHSSLFAPAAEQGWPVQPVALSYSLADGDVGLEIAYWGDMTFLPHFLNLLGKGRIEARVLYGNPICNAWSSDRKRVARVAHEAVSRLVAESCAASQSGACLPLHGDAPDRPGQPDRPAHSLSPSGAC